MKATMSSFRLARLSGAADIRVGHLHCMPEFGRIVSMVVRRWLLQIESEKPCRWIWRNVPSTDGQATKCPVLDYCFTTTSIRTMLLSKEYVGYLAREVTKKLIAGGHSSRPRTVPAVTEKVHASMLEEFSLEDRINDEVRVILEAYSEEMRNTGANYQEMFRKVKNELVRKYKAVL